MISEQRPPDTDGRTYAEKVVRQVEALRSAGVPSERIAVVGFSKGGGIAILASSLLRGPITYVFLAACHGDVLDNEARRVTGRVLSVYEVSDDLGISCGPLLARSPEVIESREVRIDTGKRHGAFYAPRDVWLAPVMGWLDAGWNRQ